MTNRYPIIYADLCKENAMNYFRINIIKYPIIRRIFHKKNDSLMCYIKLFFYRLLILIDFSDKQKMNILRVF